MQQPVRAILTRPLAVWVGLVCLLAGCGPDPGPNSGTNAPVKPFSQVSLTVRCPDPAFARAITPAAESWATLKGAKVVVQVGPPGEGDSADVGIIPAAEFGAWAARGDLAPVPASLRPIDHPLQWGNILTPYREHVIEWGGQAQALPLAGDGFVVVYRADRLADPKFAEAFRASGRMPAPPASWEDFAELAAAFASLDGKPSLPALTGAEAADLFFRVAACYDRRAMNDAEVAKLGAGAAVLSFQHDVTTGESRLESPGFRAAADWLAGLAARNALPKKGAGGGPAAALASGEASLAVLSLAQLAQLPRENGAVPTRFKLAHLPGTRSHYSPEKKQLVPAGMPNYVPYFSGGRLAVVRTRCPHPEAAFDLLAELAGPTRSLELLGTPGLGAGPFRTSHLDRDRLPAWFGYGFDQERTAALQEAMRAYVRMEVKNPVYGLRGPDQGELNAAAAEVWGKVARGEMSGADGLAKLVARWKEIDAKTPAETRLRWRKQSAGG